MTLPAADSPQAPDIAALGRAWGYETIAGVPPEFARRLYHWVDMQRRRTRCLAPFGAASKALIH